MEKLSLLKAAAAKGGERLPHRCPSVAGRGAEEGGWLKVGQGGDEGCGGVKACKVMGRWRPVGYWRGLRNLKP